MYKRARTQLSFFDSMYDRLVAKNHFLRKLNGAVDWDDFEPVFSPLYHAAGRDAHNPILMFKTLVLQFLYDLSDRDLEESINDRISFRYFLHLDLEERAPDHTNYCRFRDRLGNETIAELFNRVVAQARNRKLVKDQLCIVDATDVRAKIDTFRMHTASQDDDTDERGGPPSSIDPDARHGRKSKNKPFFGYKVGIGMDRDSGIVTTVAVTPGNEPDSAHFAAAADPHAVTVTADKGYDTSEDFALLKKRNQRAAIILKRHRGQKKPRVCDHYRTPAEYSWYYRMKRFRPAVEKIFGTAKQYYGLQRARYWRLPKMKLQALMTMLALNLRKIVTLQECVQT
jgi:IS5 family transposase